MSTNVEIGIWINGESRTVPGRQTVAQLLEALQIEGARVAVELDRRIVKPQDWATTSLQDGSRLEIVQFVGGG